MCNSRKTTNIASDLSIRADTNPAESKNRESYFRENARDYRFEHSENTSLKKATAAGINRPDTALIKPLLTANKAEVKQMFITEYDEAATMDKFRKEFIDIGVRQGIDIGTRQGAEEADRKRMEADARGMFQKGLSPEDIAEIQHVDPAVIREILGLDTQVE